MSKIKLFRMLAIFLLVIAFVLYNLNNLSAYQDEKKQVELIKEYKKKIETQSNIQSDSEENKQPDNQSSDFNDSEQNNGAVGFQEEKETQPSIAGMVGVLKIPSIRLDMPILEGATLSHLKISCSTLGDMPQVLKGSILVIAGHMSYIKYHQFNQIPNMKIGDFIYLQVKNNKYKYQVISKEVISENDENVFQNKEKESLIKLITCFKDGKKRPDKRWCITGKLILEGK